MTDQVCIILRYQHDFQQLLITVSEMGFFTCGEAVLGQSFLQIFSGLLSCLFFYVTIIKITQETVINIYVIWTIINRMDKFTLCRIEKHYNFINTVFHSC